MIVFLMQSCWNTHHLLCSWHGNTISIIYYKFHLLVIIFDFWSGNAGFARNTSVICTFIRTQLLIWVIKSMGISLQQQMNKLSTNSELGQSAHYFKAVGEVILLSWNSLKKKRAEEGHCCLVSNPLTAQDFIFLIHPMVVLLTHLYPKISTRLQEGIFYTLKSLKRFNRMLRSVFAASMFLVFHLTPSV